MVELMMGILFACLVFLLLQGFDVVPFLFFSLLLLALKMLLERSTVFQEGIGLPSSSVIPLVTFDEVGGQEAAKRDLKEALYFLKEDLRVSKLGIRPLRGVLLSGPPGTGKTLMAKAAANFTDSIFLAASGSQFVEMYAGVGAKRVRSLFEKAKVMAKGAKRTSAIVFIDEMDVLGPKRGRNSSHMEYDQTLNEFLTQLDGVTRDPAVTILVLGATNRVDLLDPALLRPGRFDRVVPVELPNKEGRLSILEIVRRNHPLAQSVSLDALAAQTLGFSGAMLEGLLNEAAICALRDKAEEITSTHVEEAMEKILLGERQDRNLRDSDRRRIAYHEAAHALVCEKTRPHSVSSISITPRGNSLGYIRQNPQAEQYLYTVTDLRHRIQVCLAGTVGEELIFHERSTGAKQDLAQAIELAKEMLVSGLSSLGAILWDESSLVLQEEIRSILKAEEEIVLAFLLLQETKLHEVAELLLLREQLSGDDFRLLTKDL